MSTSSLHQPRTSAAIAARRRNTHAMLQRVQDAITQLRRRKTPITYPAVARQASVSRTFLYENPDARTLLTAAISATAGQQQPTDAGNDASQEPSWQQRALNAETALKAVHTEIRTQRDRIATLMGQIRDTEQEWPAEASQRIATENTTLKQRNRQLAQNNRTLEERLQAARSNARFADRRIAQLEAQRLDHPPGQH